MPAFLDQQTVVAVHLVPRIPVHSWAKWHKTRHKLDFKKIVRLTDHTYAQNSLTDFEYGAHAMTGNGNYVNRLKSLKKIVKSHYK